MRERSSRILYLFAPPRGDRGANSKISALCECGRPPRGGTTTQLVYYNSFQLSVYSFQKYKTFLLDSGIPICSKSILDFNFWRNTRGRCTR